MPKFNFPLVKSIPTDAQYADICDNSGDRPPCQLRVTAYDGASAPSDNYGGLSVVNLPLMQACAGCATLIDVGMQSGCPAGTTDLEWDTDLSPSTIVSGTSEYVYVKHGYPPYEWEIESGYGYTLEHSETTSLRNTLIAGADACGTAGIKVVDMCQTEIIGEVDNSVASELNWDYDVSVETIAPGESNALIAVKDGAGPYFWSVSGTDFFLGAKTTTIGQNVLHAGWSACGPVAISVSDSCGNSCTGYVRCTAGSWVKIEDVDDLQHACGEDFLNPGTGTSEGTFSKTHGKYKVEETIGLVNCNHLSEPSCSASPTCCGDPYKTYQTAASKQYHYPCICNKNIMLYNYNWENCCDQATSLWPCCRRTGTCGDAFAAGRLYSPYWDRVKYEWVC